MASDSSGTAVFTGPVGCSSLDPQIFAVDDTGVVHALSPGWGRVTVRSASTSLAGTAPVAVGVRLARISAGYDYGCGWMTDGTGYCWSGAGASYLGILGTGSPPSNITPAPVAGGLHFSDIATGERRTCAIAEGSVYCWGSRNQHVLGFLTCPPGVTDANGGCHAPGRVDLPDTWNHVAVGTSGQVGASCVSGPDGLICWGYPASPRHSTVAASTPGPGCSRRISPGLRPGEYARMRNRWRRARLLLGRACSGPGVWRWRARACFRRRSERRGCRNYRPQPVGWPSF